MNTLVSLYENNGHTSDKWGSKVEDHTYLPIYDSLFERLRFRSNKILEIGVYRGDSLNLWAEYFRSSTIYGVDCNLSQVDIKLHDNVEIIAGDAYKNGFLGTISGKGKFDIIIDDGSHEIQHQIFFINHYIDLLTDDGILIIEEAAYNRKKELKMDVVSILLSRFPDYLKKCSYYVDRRSVKNNSNDFLIICDKSKL
jgi:predicted O-methyltransferase YrrM